MCSSAAHHPLQQETKKRNLFLWVMKKRSQKNRRMPSEFQTIEAHHFPSGSAAASLPLDFHPPSPLQLSALKIQKAKPKYLRDLQGISTNPRSFFKVQLLVPHKNLNWFTNSSLKREKGGFGLAEGEGGNPSKNYSFVCPPPLCYSCKNKKHGLGGEFVLCSSFLCM